MELTTVMAMPLAVTQMVAMSVHVILAIQETDTHASVS